MIPGAWSMGREDGRSSFRVLQLSDPHLLADPQGSYRSRRPLPLLRRALSEAGPADWLVISGDLCQDESWGGYVRLRELLEEPSLRCRPVLLLAGNHDQPQRLRAALGRRAVVAPALIRLGTWTILALESHRAGCTAGWLGSRQLAWVRQVLAAGEGPVLVVVHHPPLAIGDRGMDAIGLRDGDALLADLATTPRTRGVIFGHVHQHWEGTLPGRPGVPLLACPSTLCGFPAVQPCPLGRDQDLGGRLLELDDDGGIRHQLLRWSD